MFFPSVDILVDVAGPTIGKSTDPIDGDPEAYDNKLTLLLSLITLFNRNRYMLLRVRVRTIRSHEGVRTRRSLVPRPVSRREAGVRTPRSK